MKAQIEFDDFHKEDLERIRNLRLIDDEFLEVVFKDITCTEFLLRTILNKNDLIVNDVVCQFDIKNLQGRSVRFDVFAVDNTNTMYDVEIQRSSAGAIPKRARYNSSLMDTNITKRGESYKDLNDSYVIFITETDVLGYGLPLYTIRRYIEEVKQPFDDGSCIIYVNSQIQDYSALGQLMHDFYCTDPDDMFCDVLAKRVSYFKESEEGVSSMCKMLEEMREEAVMKDRIKNVISFYSNGASISLIAKSMGMSERTVKEILIKNSEKPTKTSSKTSSSLGRLNLYED